MSTLLTIITTAILTYVFTLLVPYVKGKWNAIKNATKRRKTRKKSYLQKPHQLLQLEIEQNAKKIKELEEQMDNVAERLATRDKNRKYNTRREVREYLEELKNG